MFDIYWISLRLYKNSKIWFSYGLYYHKTSFGFFCMCCDFKRMLARDSWLHSITSKLWITKIDWVQASKHFNPYFCWKLVHCWQANNADHTKSSSPLGMSINYPFQAIDFAGKFFLSAPSRVMKVQALTWCSGCTFFKGEHIFQLGSLTSSFCFCFADYSQYVCLWLLASLFNFSSYSLQDGKV